MDYFDDPNLCLICFGYHPLKYCKYFKTFTILQRNYLVNVHRYCPICFSKAHRLDECILRNNCSKCNGRHHTMLHPMEEEWTEHRACLQHRCHSASCGIVCDAGHHPRLVKETPFQSFGSSQTEQMQCGNTTCRTHIGQYAGNNDQMARFSSIRKTLNDFDCTTSRCGLMTTNLSCTKSNTRKLCPSAISNEKPSTSTSRWSKSIRNIAKSEDNQKVQHCCNKQTCGNIFGSLAHANRTDEESNDSTTQSFRFWRTSPTFESISNNSSSLPISSLSFSLSPFSTRQSPSPLINIKGCEDAKDEILFSDPQQKCGKLRGHKKGHCSTNEQTLSPSRLLSSTISTKTSKETDSDRKSKSIKTRKSCKKTKVKKTQPAKEQSVENPRCTTSSLISKVAKLSNAHHQNFHQIQLYLQQLLRLLKNPKEYFHTTANWRRQPLLRQELSQLKTQVKKLILDIQEYPNLHSSLSNKTTKQKESSEMLFYHLFTLLGNSNAISSNQQLISFVNQLMDHLKHQIKMNHITNAKVFRFQHFLRELKNLKLCCQETDRSGRVDLLQQSLNLRIILRNLLKAALEQLTNILR